MDAIIVNWTLSGRNPAANDGIQYSAPEDYGQLSAFKGVPADNAPRPFCSQKAPVAKPVSVAVYNSGIRSETILGSSG